MSADVLSQQAARDVLVALDAAHLPGVEWVHGDDLCDCTFQKVMQWSNPYLATTEEIRLCCIYARLGEMWPDLVRQIPAYADPNANAWQVEPWEWDGEDDMPKALWYRQLARRDGTSLTDVRERYADRLAEKPVGTPRPAPEPGIDPIAVLWDAIAGLAAEVAGLRK